MYHFLQTSLVLVYSSVQLYSVYGEPKRSRVRVLALTRIFLEHFFRHCATLSIFFGALRLFFDFFYLQMVPPSSFFDILQQTKVPKSPKGLHFYVFRHYETVKNSHFSFCFENLKNRNFLSSKDPPFNLFDILQQTGFSKSSKGPLFTGLKTALSEL